MTILEAPKCLKNCYFLKPRNWSRLKPYYQSTICPFKVIHGELVIVIGLFSACWLGGWFYLACSCMDHPLHLNCEVHNHKPRFQIRQNRCPSKSARNVQYYLRNCFEQFPGTAKLRIWTLRFGCFGPRIAFRATGALWGRATPFSYHFNVHLSSVLGRTEPCHEVWNRRPKNPKSSARKTTTWHCSKFLSVSHRFNSGPTSSSQKGSDSHLARELVYNPMWAPESLRIGL